MTTIDIRADIHAVWAVLTDFHAYPEWNPFIKQIHGYAEVGKRLQVHMTLDHKNYVFRPVVRRVAFSSELSWIGHLWMPGLFDGEHIFVLEPGGEGITRFIQKERFTGLLAVFLGWTLTRKARVGFESMNQALRDRAEGL
ncbi:MAG: SRPBCC family protein [Acidiferrobacter sp.]